MVIWYSVLSMILWARNHSLVIIYCTVNVGDLAQSSGITKANSPSSVSAHIYQPCDLPGHTWAFDVYLLSLSHQISVPNTAAVGVVSFVWIWLWKHRKTGCWGWIVISHIAIPYSAFLHTQNSDKLNCLLEHEAEFLSLSFFRWPLCSVLCLSSKIQVTWAFTWMKLSFLGEIKVFVLTRIWDLHNLFVWLKAREGTVRRLHQGLRKVISWLSELNVIIIIRYECIQGQSKLTWSTWTI